MDTLRPDPPPGGGFKALLPLVLGTGLVVSLIGNGALLMRGPTVVHEPAPAPVCPPAPVVEPTACPPAPACPACEVCEVCEVCDDGRNATTGTASHDTTPRPRAPRVDEAAAAEGEAHLAHAESEGERDPVQVAAQRRVADGVDRIVQSHSAASARRFFQRNLPGIASMDCAFRDPASAEHVRMQLRPMNDLLPPNERLTDEQLRRYERDLRCPRE